MVGGKRDNYDYNSDNYGLSVRQRDMQCLKQFFCLCRPHYLFVDSVNQKQTQSDKGNDEYDVQNNLQENHYFILYPLCIALLAGSMHIIEYVV